MKILPSCDCIIPLDQKFNTFTLATSICNHGFFMMAPNRWDPSTTSFSRPLRLADSTSVTTSISQPPGKDHLHIKVFGVCYLSLKDELAIKSQVTRMLRLSDKDEEDVRNFHKLLPGAKVKGFGRLFRSPTLFEDVVKSLLLRFCTWQKSLLLAEALCDLQHKKIISKRKRGHILPVGDFPSPEELASFSEKELKCQGQFGYRTAELIILAKEVVDGKIELSDFEKDIGQPKNNPKILGAGPFTIHTIMMCVGHYKNIPVDTETVRHMEEVHGLKMRKRKNGSRNRLNKGSKGRIQQIFENYDPFQSVAYWFELVNHYEQKLGKALRELLPSEYQYVTGN